MEEEFPKLFLDCYLDAIWRLEQSDWDADEKTLWIESMNSAFRALRRAHKNLRRAQKKKRQIRKLRRILRAAMLRFLLEIEDIEWKLSH